MVFEPLNLGVFFAGQNAGALIMLILGHRVNRLNSKWSIVCSVSLIVISNILIPLLTHVSFLFGIFGRILVGLADMLLQICSSSMIMKWFPPKERPFAIGLITGGRQVGKKVSLCFDIQFRSSNNPPSRWLSLRQ